MPDPVTLAVLSVGLVLLATMLIVLAIRRAERLEPYDERGYSDRELRRAAQAREDVEARRVERERARRLAALNDMGAAVDNVYPLERRELAEVVPIRAGLADTMNDSDGLGAA